MWDCKALNFMGLVSSANVPNPPTDVEISPSGGIGGCACIPCPHCPHITDTLNVNISVISGECPCLDGASFTIGNPSMHIIVECLDLWEGTYDCGGGNLIVIDMVCGNPSELIIFCGFGGWPNGGDIELISGNGDDTQAVPNCDGGFSCTWNMTIEDGSTPCRCGGAKLQITVTNG